MIARIGCVVEGHGDVDAVPVLIRRFAMLHDPLVSLHLPRPVRTPRYKLVQPGELERAATLAAVRAGSPCAVLVLVDAEDDCPAELAPCLLERASQRLPSVPVAVVVAKREFESWFLAAADSLAGKRGLVHDLTAPADPEEIRDAKGWLSKHMAAGRIYRETLDQAPLAAQFDIERARGSADSFDKFCREIERLLGELRCAQASRDSPAPPEP